MKNLISCHFNYLFNKTFLIAIATVLILSVIGDILSVQLLADIYGYREGNSLYFFNSFMILRIVSGFLAIFLMGNSFHPKIDQYSCLLLTSGVSRFRYFTSKVLTLGIGGFLFVLGEYVIYLAVGWVGYRGFVFRSDDLVSFAHLFLLLLFYGYFGMLLVQAFQNLYTIIIPFSIMNIGMLISENPGSGIYNIYNFVFLGFEDESMHLVFGAFHALFLVMIILIINFVFFRFKDL
ncbi:MAG TPA: hypothetical protein DD618_04140 [Acholeplasmatales bacterium]|nr:hypothetical protein [Acholeplasmatales bacterium]